MEKLEIKTESSGDELHLSEMEPEKYPIFKPVPMEEIVTLEILRQVFKKYDESLEVVDFSSEPGTQRGDNFLSLMYAANVRLKRKSKPDDLIGNMGIMFKAIPRNPTRLLIVRDGKYFLKESIMYNNIIPLLGNGSSFTGFPKCLSAFYDQDSENSGYIVMENLKLQGFTMLPRNHWLDLTHAKVVMMQLAKFHALSFAKWEGDGAAMLELFPEITETMWLHPDSVTSMTKLFMNNTFPDLRSLLEKGNYFNEGKVILEHAKDIFERMHRLTSVSKKFPSVVNHGDPWCNNLMFKYDEAGTPVDVKLVDYQISKIGSRMLDISYVIFTSLQLHVLNNNIMDLLRVYHDAFQGFLTTELNFKLPILFCGQELSWDLFLEEWEAYKYFGITMAFIYLPCMCANPENVPDMETLVLQDLDPGQDDKEDKFAEFMNAEHTLPRVYNLVRNHLPA